MDGMHRQYTELTAQICQAIPDPVIATDSSGQIIYANIAAQEFFGRTLRVMKSKKISYFLQITDDFDSLFEHVLAGRTVTDYDLLIETPYQYEQRISLMAAPFGIIGAEDDVSPGALFILRRIGPSRQIEQQQAHVTTAQSIASLSAILAHEIKNPLLSIRGAAQLLAQKGDAKQKDLSDLIVEETDRIRRLVQRLDVFAPCDKESWNELNIYDLLGQVRLAAESSFAKGIRFVEEYDPSLPLIYGDRDQLIRAITNIVKNAAEAVSTKGGCITFRTAYKHEFGRALSNGGVQAFLPIRLTIEDNGPGIADGILPKLFLPYVTGKTDGTGLGLSITAKVIADHNGRIECENLRDRRGACFHIALPAYRKNKLKSKGKTLS